MSVVATCLLTIGFICTALSATAHHTLLSSHTYTSALVEVEAYDRLFTEALSDPAAAAAQTELLRSHVDGVDPENVRRSAIALLRRTVPPDRLRELSEAIIDEAVAYVRGDGRRVDTDDVSAYLVDRIESHTGQTAPGWASTAQDRVDEALRFVRLLQAERGSGRDGDLVALASLLHVDETELDTMLDELVEAEPAVREVLDGVRAAAIRDDRLVDDLGVRAQVEMLVDRVNQARDVAQLVPVVGFVGAVLMLGALLLVRRCRGPGWTRSAAVVLAAALIVAAAVLAIAVPLIDVGVARIGEPAERARSEIDAGALVNDVLEAVASRIREAVHTIAAVAAIAGVALLAATAKSSGASTGNVAAGIKTGRRARYGLAATATLAVVTTCVVVVRASSEPWPRACSGSPVFCDRPFDTITFAAAHNAMATSSDGFWFPSHDLDIAGQLEAGVRVLMIDTHNWKPMMSPRALRSVSDVLGSVEATWLDRWVSWLATERSGSYLCHQHCALGATRLDGQLAEVRSFLDEHPDEIVTLIIQEDIAAAKTRAAFRAAHVEHLIYHHPRGEPWPTLGELIDRGHRLIVFEEGRNTVAAHTVDHIEETPYEVTDPSALTCEPERGGTGHDLFLMNHWIDRPVPDRTDAIALNDFEMLKDRVLRCAAERGRLPNFLAVNFVGIGDVVEVADAINATRSESRDVTRGLGLGKHPEPNPAWNSNGSRSRQRAAPSAVDRTAANTIDNPVLVLSSTGESRPRSTPSLPLRTQR